MNKKTKKEISVLMDEDANYCVIVGTNDIKEAEKALRKQEIEWYGERHEEKPIPIEDFYLADIYYGRPKGDSEDGYYWGTKPEEFFEGSYKTEEGFIAALD